MSQSRGAILALILGATLGFVRLSSAGVEPEQLRPLVAALHVHSTVSTGALTLDQLAERAEKFGLDAVILSENFVLRYEYGLFPLRGVLRRAVTFPSAHDYGIDRFLAEVALVQARHPKVVLIPGFEIAPHYFWSGSLRDKNLTMHNAQRNLLVLGLPGAEDYKALPASGNVEFYPFSWKAAINLTPVLLFIPAGWLWRCRIKGTRRHGRRNRINRTFAVLLAIVALLFLLNAWPFNPPVFSSYEERLGYQPYQALIDSVITRGGLVIWSMPEARDFSTHSFGPLGTVTVKTDPHVEALMFTTRYTGFGGLYQDHHTADQPGGVWDEVLNQYVTGQRETPAFLFGEIAFHKPGEAGIELNQVLNVLWVRERTAAGILEALRAGRLYTVGQYQSKSGLRLDEFRLECDRGHRVARSGGTLALQGAHDLTMKVAVSATDGGLHPISLTVVHGMKVMTRLAGTTPFEHQLVLESLPQAARTGYRIEVRGEGEILSNPIFVSP